MFREEFIDIIEKEDVRVTVYGDYVELEYICTHGMDAVAELSKDVFVEDLKEYYENYDPEEEALLMMQAKGNPGLRNVLADCDEWERILETLTIKISCAN